MSIILGTANFGQRYGTGHKSYQLSTYNIISILEYAASVGIDTIDTAIAYGDTEAILGKLAKTRFKYISKLPKLSDARNIEDQILGAIQGALKRLRVKELDAILLHHPTQLVEPGLGRRIHRGLLLAKEIGLVKKIGISIYSSKELEYILPDMQLDLVQGPFNIVDRRIEKSGWLQKLDDYGIEFHARSIFLRGVLLMNENTRPNYFVSWKKIFNRWESITNGCLRTKIDLCVNFVHSHPYVKNVVVGVSGVEELKSIVSAVSKSSVNMTASDFNVIESGDEMLVNPALWPQEI